MPPCKLLFISLQDIKRDVADSCQLVMVFIPKSTELYNAVKIRLCKEMPTPSQCICVGKNLKDSRKVHRMCSLVCRAHFRTGYVVRLLDVCRMFTM